VGIGVAVFAGTVVGVPVGAVTGVVVGSAVGGRLPGVGVTTAVGIPPPPLHAPKVSNAIIITNDVKGAKDLFSMIPPEIYIWLQGIDGTLRLFVPRRIMYNFTA
jgi:hypothetical protein